MSLAQEVLGQAGTPDKAVKSIMSREAAISAAQWHLARATSEGLRGYWESVVKSLQGAQS